MSTKRNYSTIKTLWGLAKSKELHMSDEDLRSLVCRETGKESLRQLTKGEISHICGILISHKEGAKRQAGAQQFERGNPMTARQRKKIAALEEELGWEESKGRLRALVKRMFGVDTVEWCTYLQCQSLIEAMKAILERQGKRMSDYE